MDGWMDGDSTTEHRSRAFCSPPHSHVFSCDEGSRRPIQPKSSKEQEVAERVCMFAFTQLPRSSPECSCGCGAYRTATLRPFLSLILFLWLYRHGASVQGRISVLLPPAGEEGGSPECEALSARRGICEVRSDQLRAAVAPLREMCVGMATQGHRHTHRHTQRGAGSSRWRQGRLREPSASGRHFQNKSMSLKTTG